MPAGLVSHLILFSSDSVTHTVTHSFNKYLPVAHRVSQDMVSALRQVRAGLEFSLGAVGTSKAEQEARMLFWRR